MRPISLTSKNIDMYWSNVFLLAVLFSPMVFGLAVGKSLSRLNLRNLKVQEVDTW